MWQPTRSTVPEKEPIGVTIRRRRRQLGLTLDDLSEKIAVSKPYLSKLETSRNATPTDRMIRQLATALDLDAEDWMARKYLSLIPRELWQRVRTMIEAAEPTMEEVTR